MTGYGMQQRHFISDVVASQIEIHQLREDVGEVRQLTQLVIAEIQLI